MDIARRIINLYYGCKCRENRIRWTVKDLAVTFNVGTTTVTDILRRYRHRFFRIQDNRKTNG